MLVFDELVTALQSTGVPFAVDEWATRPDADFGVVAIDGTGAVLTGDNCHAECAYTGTVDLFLRSLNAAKVRAVEAALTSVCEGAWYLNSRQYEAETHLTHFEWVFELEAI